MDFLTRHYEKLLLAFCLICLMAGMMIVLLSLDKNGAQIKGQRNTAQNNLSKGEMLSKEEYVPRTINDILHDKKKEVNILDGAKETPKGGLLEPVRLYMCTTEDCGHLLPFNVDKCPFCGKEQPEIAKESPEGADTDMDGMPDSFEKKYEFLNYLDRSDADKDEDGDGFTNLEEYKAGTKPDDPDDFPRLATHARCLAVFRNPILIRLEEIDTNRKEDQAQWDIRFTYPADPRTANNPKVKWKTAMTRLDDDNNLIAKTGYKVVKANIEGSGESAVMTALIQNVNDPTEQYELTAKEEPKKSKYVTVRVMFMSSRSASDYKAMLKRSKVVNVGDEFELEKTLTASSNTDGDMMGERSTGRGRRERNENASSDETFKERYRVISANEDTGICKVGYIDKEGGTVLTEFEIPKFDEENDFVDKEMRGDMDMMDNMSRPGRRPPRR